MAQIILKRIDGTKANLSAKSLKSSDTTNKYAGSNRNIKQVWLKQEVDDQLFYACQPGSTKGDDTWLIDGGCTEHMAKNQRLFTHLDLTVKVLVCMSDGALIEY